MNLSSLMKYNKENGFFKTLRHIFEKLGITFFKRAVYLMRLDLNDNPGTFDVPFDVYILTKADVYNTQNYYDGWFTKEEAIDRIEKGYLLFGVKENDKIICYEWAEFKKIKIAYLELTFHIPKHVAYLTGRYTLPEFRRKGISSKLEKWIFQYLKNRDFRFLLGLNDVTNIAARRVSRKTGYKDYQIVNYTRFVFFNYYRVTKYKSKEYKIYFSLYQAPEEIWKIYF